MYKKITKNQKGAVSMITVIFIALILTILTTSLIRLSINEQREATDDDLTTRAYYAAESGVQDAITAIKADAVIPERANECTPNTGDGQLSSDDNLDTAYTCQTIDTAPASYEAYLQEGEAVFFKLESSTLITSLRISWHIKGDSADADGSDIVLRDSSSLPNRDDWNAEKHPAMLRAQIIRTPQNSVTRDNIDSFSGFINPYNLALGLDIGTPAGLQGVISDASSCTTSALDGDYVCNVQINGFNDASNDYHLRLVSLYTSTHIKVEALDADGNPVSLLNAQAVIDVTGRAGDVYRRVEERVSLVPDTLWPNYAILSAEDLCKDFVITDSTADFNNVNVGGVDGSCVSSTSP